MAIPKAINIGLCDRIRDIPPCLVNIFNTGQRLFEDLKYC